MSICECIGRVVQQIPLVVIWTNTNFRNVHSEKFLSLTTNSFEFCCGPSIVFQTCSVLFMFYTTFHETAVNSLRSHFCGSIRQTNRVPFGSQPDKFQNGYTVRLVLEESESFHVLFGMTWM